MSSCYPTCNITAFWDRCNTSAFGQLTCGNAWSGCCVTDDGTACTLANSSLCGSGSQYRPSSCGAPTAKLATASEESNGAGAQVMGVLLMFIGTTLSVTGLNGQKWGLMWNEARAEEDRVGLNRNWRWAAGFVCFFVGQITEMVSHCCAAQSLLVAVSNVSLVTNGIIARLAFGETFNVYPQQFWPPHKIIVGWDFGATLIILGGTVLAVLYAPEFKADEMTLEVISCLTSSGTGFHVYCGLAVAFILWCLYQICNALPREERETGKRPPRGGFVYAMLSAATGSFVVTLAKIVVLVLKDGFERPQVFDEFMTYLYIVCLACAAVTTLTNLNLGLARYDSIVVLPTYYVFNTLLAMCSGMLLYQTYKTFGTLQACMFGLGICMSLGGVALLAVREGEAEDEEKVDGDGDPVSAGAVEAELEDGDGTGATPRSEKGSVTRSTSGLSFTDEVAEGEPPVPLHEKRRMSHNAQLRRRAASSRDDDGSNFEATRKRRQSVIGTRRVPIPLLDLASALRGDVFADAGKKGGKLRLGRWKVFTLRGLASGWWAEFVHCCVILARLPQPGFEWELDESGSESDLEQETDWHVRTSSLTHDSTRDMGLSVVSDTSPDRHVRDARATSTHV
eukprot:g571.t1